MFTVRLRQKFQSESTAIEELLYTVQPLAIVTWPAGTKVDGVDDIFEINLLIHVRQAYCYAKKLRGH